jgi:putative FmdB family regulatory protein
LPTYEYRCAHCDKNFDVVQSFQDDALTSCPTCGSPVTKVFGSVGIVFKGSGFYKTDSRNGGHSKKEKESANAPAGGSEGSGTTDGTSNDKKDKKETSKSSEGTGAGASPTSSTASSGQSGVGKEKAAKAPSS